jgi:hypothetical protein
VSMYTTFCLAVITAETQQLRQNCEKTCIITNTQAAHVYKLLSV